MTPTYSNNNNKMAQQQQKTLIEVTKPVIDRYLSMSDGYDRDVVYVELLKVIINFFGSDLDLSELAVYRSMTSKITKHYRHVADKLIQHHR